MLRTGYAVGRATGGTHLQVRDARLQVVVPAPGPGGDVAVVEARVAQRAGRVQVPAVAGIALVARLPAVDEVVLEVGQLHAPHVPRGVAHRDRARHPAVAPHLHGRLQAAVVDRLEPALHRVHVVQPLHLVLAVEQPLQGAVRVVVVAPVALPDDAVAARLGGRPCPFS
jgi:hypothetical protein